MDHNFEPVPDQEITLAKLLYGEANLIFLHNVHESQNFLLRNHTTTNPERQIEIKLLLKDMTSGNPENILDW